MDTPTYESLLESARKKMISDFQSARADIPHYGERGSEIEQVLIKWLGSYLPKRYAVGSGFILGLANEISPQTDIIIYDAINSPVLRYSDKSLILPSDNVAVAIEVKSNLNKNQYLDAVDKMGKIKSLSKSPITDLDLLSEGGKKIVQRQTYSILFAFESEVSLKTVSQWYRESFVNGRHLDFVCILNMGWIDLLINPFGSQEYAPIHNPEAITIPTDFKKEVQLFAASHEEPDSILYYLLKNIVSHLQVFRNQMFIYDRGLLNKPTTCCLEFLGMLPRSLSESTQPIERIKKITDF